MRHFDPSKTAKYLLARLLTISLSLSPLFRKLLPAKSAGGQCLSAAPSDDIPLVQKPFRYKLLLAKAWCGW
jgi:hypothetical protein